MEVNISTRRPTHVRTSICTSVFALVDLVLTTVLYARGTQYRKAFSYDVYTFDVTKSMFDIWTLGLLRFCIIIGGAVAVLCNPKTATNRVRKVYYFILLFTVLTWLYPFVKMLMYIETADISKIPWFWSLFAWSIVSPLGFHESWTSLGRRSDVTRTSRVNGDDEDQLPIVDNKEDENKDDEDEEDAKEKSATLGRILSYAKPDFLYFFVGLIFLVASSIAEIFTPFYTGLIINSITIDKSRDEFINAIVVMSLISLGSAIASGCRGGLFALTTARLGIRVRNALFSSIMKQEIGFFDKIRTGELTSRLTADTETMSATLSEDANMVLRNAVKIIGIVVFMLKLSWQLSMVTLLGTPIIIVFSHAYGVFYQDLSKRVQDSLASANEVAEETCSSMRTVRSFANEHAEVRRYSDKLRVTYRLQVNEAWTSALFEGVTEIFVLGLIVATLFYGGHLVLTDRMQGGLLVSFLFYQFELGFALESIGYVYTDLMRAIGAAEKIFQFIDRKPEIENTGTLAPSTMAGHVEFKNVTFAYPTRPDTDILKDVSFTVAPGEVVALVGPSGSGKSSCINLLEHFYESKDGAVLIDGAPVHEYDHTYLHTKVALVGQEPVLYARSIKDNIAYAMEDTPLEQVERAAKQANAHGFISDLEGKYYAETGEKGAQVSGGQKQRIAIARALIRQPAVLLLDEATSALDAESEHVVQQAIYSNLKGKTVIIIAHRLSTVERADRIVVIEKGAVREQGTHTDLLAAGGLYADLVEKQLMSSYRDTDEPPPRSSPFRLEEEDEEARRARADSNGSGRSGPHIRMALSRQRSVPKGHRIRDISGSPKDS